MLIRAVWYFRRKWLPTVWLFDKFLIRSYSGTDIDPTNVCLRLQMMRRWASQMKKGLTDEDLFVHLKFVGRCHQNQYKQHIWVLKCRSALHAKLGHLRSLIISYKDTPAQTLRNLRVIVAKVNLDTKYKWRVFFAFAKLYRQVRQMI